MNPEAQRLVRNPSIGLMVAGGLGIAASLVSIVVELTGVAAEFMARSQEGMPEWLRGLGIFGDLIAIALAAFVIYGALQMQKLRSWNLCLAASIVAMIPCGCTCCLGIPFGIWAIIVLAKPEVKQAFGAA